MPNFGYFEPKTGLKWMKTQSQAKCGGWDLYCRFNCHPTDALSYNYLDSSSLVSMASRINSTSRTLNGLFVAFKTTRSRQPQFGHS